ncbi:MAG: sigma-70 family RNA polymerase sigma factor [Anaerolineae bacterium]|nr:sigma-70 family RNA polymerase sigma factor [Anaerolineae bacterium]
MSEREGPTERELIQAAAAGNMGAFAQLVQTYRARVLRTAYGLLGSLEEAEDVAQEVFIKVWKGLPNYRPSGSLANWLYRITVNTAIDTLRKRHETFPLDGQELDPQPHPEETVLRHDRQSQVRAAIQALPSNARAALILREYEQLSYKEIAAVLQIPLGTVMSRLNYARNRLKELLEETS